MGRSGTLRCHNPRTIHDHIQQVRRCYDEDFPRLAALAGLSLCVGLSVAQAIAKDYDSAGVSDQIQHRLGIDADATRRLEVVWESPKPAAADPSRDIRRILLGNVAGNRYLWVLEFAAEFPFKNTNLTVYVDADNNPKTGRSPRSTWVPTS